MVEQWSRSTASTPPPPSRRSGVDRRMVQRTEAAACMSAAAALCHIQIDPSCGRGILYLHATAGEAAGAKRKIR